jgi:hypothetical protein
VYSLLAKDKISNVRDAYARCRLKPYKGEYSHLNCDKRKPKKLISFSILDKLVHFLSKPLSDDRPGLSSMLIMV